MQNSVDHETLFIVFYVGLHVSFSMHSNFLDHLGPQALVKSEWDSLRIFNNESLDFNGQGTLKV